MKAFITMAILGLLAVLPARAQTSASQTFGGGQIPSNPVGFVFTGDFTSAPADNAVTGVTVDLNVTGGIAGGLYAYLLAPGGAMAVLLNQPGVTADNPFGNQTLSLALRLADGGPAITADSDLALGTGSPYAAADHLSLFGTPGSPGDFADGNWHLFFANLTDNGGNPVTLNNWTLNVMTIPEPGMPVFAGAAFLMLLLGSRRRRDGSRQA